MVLITRIVAWSVVASDERRFFDRDTVGYTLPAKALLEKRQFLTGPEGPVQFNTFRSPGYPFWIVVHHAIFGDSADALVVSNLFLFTGTLRLLFKLTDGLFGKRAAFIAAVLLSLDPLVLFLRLRFYPTLRALFLSRFFYILPVLTCRTKDEGPLPFTLA